MWEGLGRGAVGWGVRADPGRLDAAFAPVDCFADRRRPHIVGVNTFDGELQHDLEDVRDALSVEPQVPVIACDARTRESTKQTLITLVEYAMRQWMSVRSGVTAN